MAQQTHCKCRNDLLVQQIELKNASIDNWPQIPTWTVIMDCLRNYQMQLVIHILPFVLVLGRCGTILHFKNHN